MRSLVAVCLLALGCGTAEDGPNGEPVWNLDNLTSIGGAEVSVLGAPRLDEGRFVEFDGLDDGLIVETHPLAGATRFTAEVIFRPDEGGAREQRFLHLQEDGSEDRILFETRLTGDGRWFLDTYVKSGGDGTTLYAKRFPHPIGPWYHAALVVDGDEMRHYVDGNLEMSREIDFRPQEQGRTSIGMRVNRVHWFKGAVRRARFTPRVLSPEEFLDR
jgi:hypothetical protein